MAIRKRSTNPNTIRADKYRKDQTHYTIQKLVDARQANEKAGKDKKCPGKGFDIAKMARFMRKLSEEPVEAKAARLTNVSISTLTRWKNDIPGFREEMDKAKQGFIDVLLEKAINMAMGTDGKPSERLMIKLLEKFDPSFRDNVRGPLVQIGGESKTSGPVFNIHVEKEKDKDGNVVIDANPVSEDD